MTPRTTEREREHKILRYERENKSASERERERIGRVSVETLLRSSAARSVRPSVRPLV